MPEQESSPQHPASDPQPGFGGADRRLHPWSWLFVLLTQLRPMVFPLVLLLLFGRGDRWVFFGALGAVGLSLYAIVYSVGFRYRLQGEELIVREGIFNRTERHIPLARIHNVVQRRNPLHRLFGVTELRLESAGGVKPEAVMNVIARREADRLEHLLREGTGHSTALHASAGEADAAAPEVLHSLGFGELVRLGVSSNRGVIALAALWGASFQFDVDYRELPFVDAIATSLQKSAWGFVGAHGVVSVLIVALGMLLLVWLLLRLLSVAIAIIKFHGFRLERQGQRIVSESGLLTRTRAGATPRRIQRVTVRQSWLLARMHRVSLEVTLAGANVQGERQSRLRWLAPIATLPAARRILAEIRPEADWTRDDWRPLHPRAAWRIFKWPALVVFAVAGVAGLANPWAWWGWLLLPWLWLGARGRARFAAYSVDSVTFAARDGWLSHRWDSVRLRDIQAVQLRETPGDRRNGMARVAVASAGGSGISASPIEVAWLPLAEAVALRDRLRGVVSHEAPEPSVAVLM